MAAPFLLGSQSLNVPVKSLAEVKQNFVVRQKHDFTCGSAALATILQYNYGINISEQQIIRWIIGNGKNLAQAKREGFSLLDMKRFVQSQQLTANGYKNLSLSGLYAKGLPAIVAINREGYRHFVVVRDIQNNHVLLANPATGNEWLGIQQFVDLWENKVGFYVYATENGQEQSLINHMAARPEEMNITSIQEAEKNWRLSPEMVTRHPLHDYLMPKAGRQ